MQSPAPITVQSAITKLEDDQKKHEIFREVAETKEIQLHQRLADFGYSDDEAKKIAKSLPEKSPVRNYIQNGTIPDKRSLDSVLSAFNAKSASKHLS